MCVVRVSTHSPPLPSSSSSGKISLEYSLALLNKVSAKSFNDTIETYSLLLVLLPRLPYPISPPDVSRLRLAIWSLGNGAEAGAVGAASDREGVVFSSPPTMDDPMPESRSRRRLATSLRRPWRALGSRLLAEESRRLFSLLLRDRDEESRLGGLDPISRDDEFDIDGDPVDGTPRPPMVVDARTRGLGFVVSSGRSHIPTAD